VRDGDKAEVLELFWGISVDGLAPAFVTNVMLGDVLNRKYQALGAYERLMEVWKETPENQRPDMYICNHFEFNSERSEAEVQARQQRRAHE
jgi:hypothetical protein